MFVYSFLDWFFIIFHLLVVLFNLFGWIWKATRLWNLYLLILTGIFWFGFGVFYGWGYCPLTDWHFTVLEKLGNNTGETSYIGYLINRFLKISVKASLVDSVTLISYLCALVVSIYLNVIVKRKREA
ncbi:MAG: DUF2784 domain-containing protein [Bacteroidales bacterium]|nr:MAG: DUF2784 domain-containing protein [Bacteroidales bacterium]